MTHPFFITTPIYYVNDRPHIGHAYTTLACDVRARMERLRGRDVFFLTGTDEHGQKVEQSARARGMEPQAFTNEVSQHFRDLIVTLGATPDDFIRTTQGRHRDGAQAFWQRLQDAGAIYLDTYAGWYAVRDECYYQENELVGGKAPTGADVAWHEEKSYFFRLSAYQDKLLDLYKNNPDFVSPPSRLHEVTRFVEGGLKDLSISRSTFSWGIPVPGDPDHVMYVWLDALVNYLTAAGYPGAMNAWPADVHVVGKDIVRFHAVYWPAFLMAAGLPLPKQIFAHGWWTNEGQKISKSLGNTIDPGEIIETFGLDATRYFLLREVPFGQDGDFSRDKLLQRANVDLANDYGNLCQRTLSMIVKHNDGQLTLNPNAWTAEDQAFLALLTPLTDAVTGAVSAFAFHTALEKLWEVIRSGNRYIDHQQPWSLKKTDPQRMMTVLSCVWVALRHVTILLQPFMPTSTAAMLDQLGVSDRSFSALEDLPTGVITLGVLVPVFQKF
jgi:methionyl-tRNA synthetase